jgi:hypothetical protein
MAEISDIESEIGELETVEEQIQDEQVEQATQKQAAPESEDDDIPPQFRGKSLKDIAKYAASTEKALSKQGNELGEVRRLADELLKSQLVASKASEPEKKEVDFFENPQEAVRNLVDNHPAVLQAQQMAVANQRTYARQAFLAKHPDAPAVVQDPEFVDWIKGSKIRSQLFQAAEAYDVDAGDELLSTFKQLRAVKQRQVQEVDTKVRDQSLRAAAVDTGGSGESSRKIYRRTDLINLKIRDPNKYEAMGDEILAAYAQGRVR